MSSNKISLQDDRRKLMKEILDLFDPNNQGFINSADTTKILQAMGRKLKEDEQNFSQAADPENTGKISKDNFLTTVEALFSLSKDETSELIEAFKIFDINNTGKISVKDFKKILVKIGQEFSEEEANDVINYINVDKDGNINYADFIQVWKFQ